MLLQRARRARPTLLDDEEILFEIDHHWLTGVTTLVIPVGILLVFLGLAIYSAAGGGFTVEYRAPRLRLDLLSWLYVGLVAFIGAIWVLMGVAERGGYQGRRWGLLAMGLLVVVVLAFRVAGGELFVPGAGAVNLLRPVSLLLLLVAAVAAIVVVYLLVDLLHDKLFLTNQRVIYYNGAVLIPGLVEKQVQQEVMLEDIQNVLSRTETYLQHWLDYGNITVQAANAGRPITFRGANHAKEMQRRIFGARGGLLKRQAGRNFAQLIDSRVYEDPAAKRPYSYPYPIIRTPFFARWVLDDNPKVDVAQGMVTWYPHWIFLALALIWPLLGFAAVAALLGFAAAGGLLGAGPLVLLGLVALVICALWSAYMVEDYRNDRYIVTGSTIIDIDKRPLGPEGRRSAGLGTIQTVNYRTSFLSNMIGYGDVVVQTAGKGGAFTFARVPRPRDVAATLNQHISAYRKGERERTLDESLSLLRQFHLLQSRLGELKAAPPPEAGAP
ncbi:MAG TPA: PH domain-containing protein [Chloroflexaceae bacterium]|nr:PH domain-containing protein [Chloroflexaceae bacterium]